MQLQPGQRVRVMWLRDIIASDTANEVGGITDTTISGMLIPAGTIYDGLVMAATADGFFEMVLAHGEAIRLHVENPAIAVAVLSQFAPRQV